MPERVEQDHRLVMHAQITRCPGFEELLEGADATGQRDERIGAVLHHLLALAHGVGDDQFVGFINDVAVFNYALTATEVTNEFQGIPGPSVNQNPTNIVASVSGNQLTLAWPVDHTGWQLQVQTNSLSVGLGNNWVPVSGSTGVNEVVVPMDPANGSVFYRLVYPPSP